MFASEKDVAPLQDQSVARRRDHKPCQVIIPFPTTFLDRHRDFGLNLGSKLVRNDLDIPTGVERGDSGNKDYQAGQKRKRIVVNPCRNLDQKSPHTLD